MISAAFSTILKLNLKRTCFLRSFSGNTLKQQPGHQTSHLIFVSPESHSALGSSTSTPTAIGAVVDQISSINSNLQDHKGLRIPIDAQKMEPFHIPAGVLRSPSKSVGRWPEFGSDKSYFTQPGHRGGMSMVLSPDATNEAQERSLDHLMPTFNFEPDLFLMMSDSAPHEFLRYLDSLYPKSKKVLMNRAINFSFMSLMKFTVERWD
jgi:hypothetical protein